MQAIILAGGKGTRLRPLTLDLPKPVVPLVNRPLILYQLDLMAGTGIREVTLSLSYRPDRIKKALEGMTGEVTLRYAVEEEPLGTGGAVRFAADPGAGTAVVFNGDIISDLDLRAVLAFHREKKSGVTIVLTEVEDPTSYGLVESFPDGRVGRFLEKPGWDEAAGRNINAGVYVIEPEYLEMIPAGRPVSIEREFFPALVRRGAPFHAHIHRGYWIDIGTVAKYLKAHSDLMERGTAEAGRREIPPGLSASPGAAVDPSVEVHGRAVVGPGSSLGAGVVIRRFAVIGRDCRIGEGVHLDACVLWDGVRVGAGSRLTGCVLGDGSRVGEGARLPGLFALGSGGWLPDFSHHQKIDEFFEEE